jgi:aerobic-type carbon monoxide dehydrogenase small subunit (CoxS/CutS family)
LRELSNLFTSIVDKKAVRSGLAKSVSFEGAAVIAIEALGTPDFGCTKR